MKAKEHLSSPVNAVLPILGTDHGLCTEVADLQTGVRQVYFVQTCLELPGVLFWLV